ncbi:MAG: hypothetical protein P4L28_00395 [Paludibacteraceae bacterium]|nr:hypothetical protein [Paludibacteraceae bacterium]
MDRRRYRIETDTNFACHGVGCKVTVLCSIGGFLVLIKEAVFVPFFRVISTSKTTRETTRETTLKVTQETTQEKWEKVSKTPENDFGKLLKHPFMLPGNCFSVLCKVFVINNISVARGGWYRLYEEEYLFWCFSDEKNTLEKKAIILPRGKNWFSIACRNFTKS